MTQNNNLALYIHWPWCKKKCPYCDFNSHVSEHLPEEDYVDCLLRDIAYQASLVGKRTLTSLFFGGGTPSLMSPQSVEKIIYTADKYFTLNKQTEITLESNPTSSGVKKFQQFSNAGINRLSIGVQSLQNNLLSFLGREHSSKEALKTIDCAQNIIQNISLDLIYGLPNQPLALWLKDLSTAAKIGIQHISAYQLTIEPNTTFFTHVRHGKWAPIANDLQADFFEGTSELLSKFGYQNYEISNFAKPGFSCKHNTHVWRYKDYLGIGAGAHGRFTKKDGSHVSTQHYKKPATYMTHITSKDVSFYLQNETTSTQRHQERFLFGLRLKEGVSLQPSKNSPQKALQSEMIKKPAFLRMLKLGYIKINNNHLYLTKKGWPLLDSVLENLLL